MQEQSRFGQSHLQHANVATSNESAKGAVPSRLCTCEAGG
jgi:hypothetical protein